jgi:tetratricopeptide (TPR) repeat protein
MALNSYPFSGSVIRTLQIFWLKEFKENCMDSKEWLEEGIRLLKEKEYEDAIKAFDEAIEINSQYAPSWHNKGKALGKLKRYEEALIAFEKAIEINPKNANAWYNKGIVLFDYEKYEDAIRADEKAIEINPKQASFWYNKGVALGKLERHEEALRAFEKALKIKPKHANAWYNKGIILYNNKKYEEALKAFEQTIGINPKHAKAWNNKGVMLSEKFSRYKDSIKAYSKAIDVSPEYALAYSNLAEVNFELGNLKSAVEGVETALEYDANLVPALRLKGRIKIEEKDYKIASEYFRKAISLDVGNVNLLLWDVYANCLYIEFPLVSDTNKYRETLIGLIRSLERVYDLTKKKDDGKTKAYILYFLGCFYYKSGDIYSAKTRLEKCVRLKSPIKKTAREMLGNIWNYKIRPSWWRWWLDSPTHPWPKRTAFMGLSGLIFGSFLLHPFLRSLCPLMKVNWGVYTFFIAFLIFIILSPCIQRIKTKDIEVEMAPPPPFEPMLSPNVIEEKMREIES